MAENTYKSLWSMLKAYDYHIAYFFDIPQQWFPKIISLLHQT